MDGFDGNIASLLSRLGTQGPAPLYPMSRQFPGSCGVFLCGCHSCSELERAVGMPVAGLPTSPLSSRPPLCPARGPRQQQQGGKKMTPPPSPRGKESWLPALLLARKPWVLVWYGASSQVTSELGPPSLGRRAQLPTWTHGASPSRVRKETGKSPLGHVPSSPHQ